MIYQNVVHVSQLRNQLDCNTIFSFVSVIGFDHNYECVFETGNKGSSDYK